ncbi:MAG: hypothetical protein ABID38_05590 [Candidatus Diapherotrites archaeon]
MLPIEQLSFAQKYPFSSLSRKVVKENDLSLDKVPEEVLARAREMVNASYGKGKYSPEIRRHHEILINEILAYPVAKILVSLINSDRLNEKFASMLSNSVFQNLEKGKDEIIFDISSELGAKAQRIVNGNIFAKLKIMDFLVVDGKRNDLKLVNLSVEKGNVFLNRNDFARFVSLLAEKKLLDSLPVDVSSVPDKFISLAEELGKKKFAARRKSYGLALTGKVNPDFFPECYAELYGNLLAGKNLTHLARFDLAVFLSAIGMGKEEIIDLFRNAPNFNEGTTTYQIDRLIKAKYSAPSCSKLRTHKVCKSDCNVKHPVQYYENQIMQQKSSQAKAS